MATWVVQTNLIDPIQVSQILDQLNVRSIPYVAVDVYPYVDTISFWSEMPTETKVIPYGSSKLARLANLQGWVGMFFDREKFRVDTWNNNRNDMLNSDARVILVAELNKQFESIPDGELYFIRPVEDLKAFNGTVTIAKEIRKWMSSVDSGNFSFDASTPVVVASPKNILAEWRWFIVDGDIVSGSIYKMHGQRLVQRENDRDVIDEAQGLADVWLPNQTCVMDVALTHDGPRVIEFNCFNSSGFYYHDIGTVVEAVTKQVDTML